MWFLFLQIWGWLLAAFVLGWFAHWFFCCRGKDREHDSSLPGHALHASSTTATANIIESQSNSSQATPAAPLSPDQFSEDWKPMLFSEAPQQVDDLKQIKGVGRVLEETLQSLGVYQFEQVAGWTDEHVAWMDNYLSFTGRIDRENWREQARILARGDTTEFASKVEKGDIEY